MSAILAGVRIFGETTELDHLLDVCRMNSGVKWKDDRFGAPALSVFQTELSKACRRREGVLACIAGKTEAVGIHAGRFYHAF
jgi:hypothetical protein